MVFFQNPLFHEDPTVFPTVFKMILPPDHHNHQHLNPPGVATEATHMPPEGGSVSFLLLPINLDMVKIVGMMMYVTI